MEVKVVNCGWRLSRAGTTAWKKELSSKSRCQLLTSLQSG
jgi:hypothetical protein